jgi:hypothetical protein
MYPEDHIIRKIKALFKKCNIGIRSITEEKFITDSHYQYPLEREKVEYRVELAELVTKEHIEEWFGTGQTFDELCIEYKDDADFQTYLQCLRDKKPHPSFDTIVTYSIFIRYDKDPKESDALAIGYDYLTMYLEAFGTDRYCGGSHCDIIAEHPNEFGTLLDDCGVKITNGNLGVAVEADYRMYKDSKAIDEFITFLKNKLGWSTFLNELAKIDINPDVIR